MKKVVLAYSGGLDTSVAIKWLKDRGYEVIAYMADVGQEKTTTAAIARAKKAGAAKVVVRDLKKKFVTDYIWPALKAGAVYEGRYTLATALSRPLIAAEQVAVAHAQNATAVAHGCTGKGNDQVRFEVTVQILDSALEILAPVREWEFKSRQDEIRYAQRHGIPIEVSKKSPFSIDKNIWGVSIEAGVLEDPNTEPPADAFQWTRGAQTRNLKEAVIEIEFFKGVPVGLNGKKMEAIKLITALNELGSRYGIGRMDMIENRLVGIKSRETYEAPAATILIQAHKDLEALVLDRELLHYKEGVAQKYAELVYYGLWFTPLRSALDAFVRTTQEKVTGTTRMKLRKYSAYVVGRTSPYSRYNESLATYTVKDKFDQRLAKGFIDLWALPYKR
ncbi:MAG: argininosuccinate synthase [Candidatus Omnitrophica bacterium CG07_land_8_20_14_0_80_50_8]|nr:MAG: argininosuccinate synthase [Candidatus Omnitrophica bacterium CG07_land_8_20_14_0_80_50_8]